VRLVGLAICLCITATGCGATIIKNDVSGPVAACDSFAYASCNRLSQCQQGVNVDNCAQLLSSRLKCAAASCGTGVFNPAGAQACLDGYTNQSCSDSIGNVIPTACAAGTNTICAGP